MRARMMYVAGAAAVALAAVAGLASAGALGIGTGGTISACYQVANGNLRAVATGTACRGGERALSWSQNGTPGPAGAVGPAGPAGAPGAPGAGGADGADGTDGADGADGANGAPGANGAAGTNGVSVTSTPLSSGNPNCPAGGSSFTSATGITYACNGAAGGGSAPVSEEGTGPGVGWFDDGAPHEVAMVVTSTRSLVTGLASISFLPAESAGVTQPVTVVCAIQAGVSQIGSATVGAPTGAYGGIASLTAQGFSGVGTYHLTCQRRSASGSYFVSSPKLTAIAVS